MSVETSKPTYPEIKSIHRIAAVPIVHDSLTQIDSIITSISYTNYVKVWAQAWGAQAYKISEPYGAKLAPVITSVDGYANQGLDFVQRRFPYPFIAPTDEIIQKVKSPADQAYSVATTYVDATHKALNEKVIAPAYKVGHDVDKGISPYVDQIEAKVRPYVPKREGANDEPHTSVERVVDLGKDSYARALTLSSEQFKQLQQQSVLLQQATRVLDQLNGTLHHTASAAQKQSQDLANQLLKTLDHIQQSTAKLPSDIQHSLQPFTDQLKTTYSQLLDVSHQQLPLGEKVGKLAGTAQEGLVPILHMAAERVQKLLWRAKVETDKAVGNGVDKAKDVGNEAEAEVHEATNGH